MDNDRLKTSKIVAGIALALIAALLIIFSFCMCSPRALPPQSVVRDSLVYRDRIVRDTVVVEVPRIVERVVTRDTSSHLSNDWAASDAVVSGGFLSHSLETRERKVYVPVSVIVHDTIEVQKQAEIRHIVEEVEKPLSLWQRFRIGAFWWLLLAGAAGWVLFVKFR